MTKKIKSQRSIAAPSELSRAFVSTVQESFRRVSSGARSSEVNITISASRDGTVSLDSIQWPFWIVARFESALVTGRICFGDRELIVTTELAPAHADSIPPDGYAFWEWASAMGQETKDLADSEWCTQPERVESVTDRQIKWLDAFAHEIAAADDQLISRLGEARLKRVQAWEEAQAVQLRRREVAAARRAFRDKAFGRVVELLGPFEGQLSPAEAKQLELARAALQRPPA